MERLKDCIRAYIIDEPSMREKNMDDVRRRVSRTFGNRRYRENVENSGDRNWLQMDVREVIDTINGAGTSTVKPTGVHQEIKSTYSHKPRKRLMAVKVLAMERLL